jgi:hypothetical protein
MLSHNLYPRVGLHPSTTLRRLGRCALALAGLAGVSGIARAQTFTPVGTHPIDVTTYAYDNLRSGQNTSEGQLTPVTVAPRSFGKLFSVPVDGQVYAQPLYLHSLSIPGKGVHNVVFIATEHDSVYAFDADTNTGANSTPLWQVSFLNPTNGVTSVPNWDTGSGDINPEIGISSTPVIDATTKTIYVVVKTKEVTLGVASYVHRLHALDATTGAERPNSPAVIQATVPGTGDGSDGNGNLAFNPLIQHNRPALLLLNGVVYIAYASHGDNGPYHGWLFGYDATTLQQTSVWNTTPNALTDPSGYPLAAGGIWMSGDGPSADSQGNIYLATGNGTLDVDPTDPQYPAYGDAIVKLSTTNGLAVADYFSPFNQWTLDDSDADVGSGGVLLLPDNLVFNGHHHLLIQSGKEGRIYLLDRDQLGQYNTNYDLIPQALPAGTIGGVWSKPSYFNSTIYYGGQGDVIRSFAFRAFRSRNYFLSSFQGQESEVTINGSATFTNNANKQAVLRLIDGKNNEAGSGYGNNRVNVQRFGTSFEFQFNAPPGAGDGITFILQGGNIGAVGQSGQGLGYAGIGNSIAIKYDLVQHFDPVTGASLGTSSTGLFINGATPNISYDPNYPTYDLTQSGIDLHSGDIISVSVNYDGKTLTVTTTDTVTQATAIQVYNINLPAIIGSSLGYVGFTGGTDVANGATADILDCYYYAPGLTAQLLVPINAGNDVFNFPGAVPTISASTINGRLTNGIVWALDNSGYRAWWGNVPTGAVLHAYEATTLKELYNSHYTGEDAGIAVKFTTPVVANGKVYVGSENQVTVYGQRRLGIVSPFGSPGR